MQDGVVGAVVIVGVVIGAWLWQVRQDRRHERARTVRARAHAALFRALGGDSLIAVQAEPPSRWRPGRLVLSAPADWPSLLLPAWSALAAQLPADYELVVKPVGPPQGAAARERAALRRAA